MLVAERTGAVVGLARVEAHAFYETIGYCRAATSLLLPKKLS